MPSLHFHTDYQFWKTSSPGYDLLALPFFLDTSVDTNDFFWQLITGSLGSRCTVVYVLLFLELNVEMRLLLY